MKFNERIDFLAEQIRSKKIDKEILSWMKIFRPQMYIDAAAELYYPILIILVFIFLFIPLMAVVVVVCAICLVLSIPYGVGKDLYIRNRISKYIKRKEKEDGSKNKV